MDSGMFDFEYEQKGNSGMLRLKGELTEESADHLRSALKMSLCNADSLVINFEAVTSADEACLQYLREALSASEVRRKTVSLEGERSLGRIHFIL